MNHASTVMESSAPEVVLREHFDRGARLDRFAFVPLSRLVPPLPSAVLVSAFALAGLTSVWFLSRGEGSSWNALLALIVCQILLPAVQRAELGLLARRRIFLCRRLLDASLPIAAAWGLNDPAARAVGLMAAASINAFQYSAISFVVEIPPVRRTLSGDGVKALDLALLKTPHLWPFGEESLLLLLAASPAGGFTMPALCVLAASPLVLAPQWLRLWCALRAPVSRA